MKNIFDNLFVLDMANNHQGSLDHGMKIVNGIGDVISKRKVKAALKFQFRDLDCLVHPDYKNRQDVKHIPRFIDTAISVDDYIELAKAIKNAGMLTMATPFDEPSVDLAMDMKIDILKIASCSATDWSLLQKVAKAKKPTIISTGGLKINEIDRIVAFFMHKDISIALMHCVSIYPTPNHLAQLSFMARMIKRYHDIPIGYSGHDEPDNTDIAKTAIAMGAKMMERHVGFETDEIKLNKYSMTPEQVEKWIEAAQTTWEIIGSSSVEKQVVPAEVESLLSLKRGVFAKRPISKGENLTTDNVFFAMPCKPTQLDSGEFSRYRVKYSASKDYQQNEPINEEKILDKTNLLYEIIHDVKGMLHEAKIVLGDDDVIELSHHYGVDNFRETGALIVNVINREYCKKYVIQLPGQKHPNHRHHIKEETFFLLWGDLEVNQNGKTLVLKPGQKVLIEREDWHSFSTKTGCIIEEVSTTHQIGDSEYEDSSISKSDIKLRKTIIDLW